jgi:FtsX-like permease family
MRRRTLKLSTGRVLREVGWSVVIIGVLTSGLTAWILIPSIGSTLSSNLTSYANGVGTYISVKGGGVLPQETISKISSIQGVQVVYPFVVNGTYFVVRNFTTTLGGTKHVVPVARFGVYSAVFGGPNAFPSYLLALSAGSSPGNEPGFAFEPYLRNANPPQTDVRLEATNEVVIGCSSCASITTVGSYFNATAVGEVAVNPLFSDVAVFWNSTFMMQHLGKQLYEQEWGGNRSNYLIVKVDNVADVTKVGTAITQILNPPFQAQYDPIFAQDTQSFVTQTAPLYEILGIVSLVAVIAITFLVSHLVAGKRSWEAGMLLTQGWRWGELFTLYSYYFLILSLVSFALAATMSVIASHFFTSSYYLFAQEVTITASADPFYIVSGFLLAVAMSLLASWTVVRRLKRMKLDGILREY